MALLFAPSRLKRFPAPKKNFASFEEFREFVKPLQISGPYAYGKWTTDAGRPERIPSRPDRAYAGKGWTSWQHALGSVPATCGRKRKHEAAVAAELFAERLSLMNAQYKNAAHDEETITSYTHERRHTNGNAATSWFVEYAEQHVGNEFEFYRLSQRSRANVLFRRRGDSAESWRGIRVKSTIGAGKSKYVFRLKRESADSDVAGAFACMSDEKFALLSPAEVQAVFKAGNIRLQQLPYLQNTAARDEFVTFLRSLVDAIPGAPISAFASDHRLALHETLVEQLVKNLYEPAGVALRRGLFLFHNAELAGLRVQQRTVCYSDTTPKARLAKPVILHTGESAHLYFEASEVDTPDLFVFLVHDKMRLAGVFAFPTTFLEGEGYIRSARLANAKGTSWIHLFPPWRCPAPHCLALAERQREYYIDLTGETGGSTDFHIKKFGRIVESIQRTLTAAVSMDQNVGQLSGKKEEAVSVDSETRRTSMT